MIRASCQQVCEGNSATVILLFYLIIIVVLGLFPDLVMNLLQYSGFKMNELEKLKRELKARRQTCDAITSFNQRAVADHVTAALKLTDEGPK